MKKIVSRDNPLYKRLRALAHSSRERRKQGRTVLDGMHLVSAWFERFGPPELLVVSESGRQRAEIRDWLASHPQTAFRLFDDTLFGEVSPVETPTGILALVAIPRPPPQSVERGSCVLLEAIQDAGNLGAILRTSAAAGVSDVFLAPGCAQAWSPRVLRAAMGAHFLLRIHEHVALERVLAAFDGLSVATAPAAASTLYETDLSGPIAWVFGNEGSGLSARTVAASRLTVRIPMPGKTESLNVAAAVAICLFEEARQKYWSALRKRADRA